MAPRPPVYPVPPPRVPPDPPVTPPPAGGGRRINLALVVPGAALSTLAMLAIGLVLHLTVISQLQYHRNQQTALADFRVALAQGTAPVGQYRTDYTEAGEAVESLVNPGSAVAVLQIDAIGLRAVVFEGTSGSVLRQGPGHRRDTVLPGQPGTSVLMGREAAYGGPFRDLDLLLPNDLITVTTGQGTHRYRVTGLRLPGDDVPARAAAGAGRLTLVTATGRDFVPEDVLRVDADLLTEAQPAPRRRFGAASLPAAEQPMGTDPGAWTPLVLWGQALLLAALALTYLRARLGRWQGWVVGVPVLLAFGLAAADEAARLLPNLL